MAETNTITQDSYSMKRLKMLGAEVHANNKLRDFETIGGGISILC